MVKFKYREAPLTEEQIKQRYRFVKIRYIKGEYQENYKWGAWAAFNWWHKKEMDKTDANFQKKQAQGVIFWKDTL